MKQSIELGMLTFDESLYRLHAAGRISYDEALLNADSRTDLALRIRLNSPAGVAGGLEMEKMEGEQHRDTGFIYESPASAERHR